MGEAARHRDDLTADTDYYTGQAAAASNDLERQCYVTLTKTAIARATAAGFISKDDALARLRALPGRIEEEQVEALIARDPAAAVAALDDPKRYRNLDPALRDLAHDAARRDAQLRSSGDLTKEGLTMGIPSMTADTARRALEEAKSDGDFVRRYLDGDRAAFQHMQGLLRAAYPDDGMGDAGDMPRDGASANVASIAPTAPATPAGDGGGAALPQWLLDAGDAGFAPAKSPAHYQFDYAPNVEIDPEFDGMARDWMYRAELPAGWAGEIARDYQRRAAKPPSADDVAQEREAVLGRLRRDWGEATDAKLAQVRDLVRGIGDDRLTETLDRSGLGNNEWLIRQLAILADRKAAKAAEWGDGDAGERENSRGDSDTDKVNDTRHRVIADRSGEGGQVAESALGVHERTDNPQIRRSSPKRREVGGGRKDGHLPYADIPLEGGYVPPDHVDPRMPEKLAVPRLNFGEDRQKSIIENTPSRFEVADNANVDATKPEYRINNPLDANKPSISNEEHNDHEVDRYESIIDEEAKRQGVDPNLVKAIMYMETTHGGRYGHLAERYGLSNSILPMNIGIEPWKSLGFTEADFNDPRMNIRAGVMLLKRIIERVTNPTVAKVATLYNNIRREKVNDYGARVAEIYRQQLWRIPKKSK